MTLLNCVNLQSEMKKLTETTSCLYSWLGDKKPFWCGTESAAEPSSNQTTSLANDSMSSPDLILRCPKTSFIRDLPFRNQWKPVETGNLISLEGNQNIAFTSHYQEGPVGNTSVWKEQIYVGYAGWRQLTDLKPCAFSISLRNHVWRAMFNKSSFIL